MVMALAYEVDFRCLLKIYFKYSMVSTIYDSHPQEMGVLQCSILSVFCFNHPMFKTNSLYVDDFQICYRSSNMSIIERHLQLCMNKL